jgi:hypothetical protein
MVYPRGQRPNINASFLAHRAHLWARGEAFYVETPARLGCVWNTPADLVSTKRVNPMWRRADRSLRRAPMSVFGCRFLGIAAAVATTAVSIKCWRRFCFSAPIDSPDQSVQAASEAINPWRTRAVPR